MTQNDTKHKVVVTQNINFYGFVDRDMVEWIKSLIDILMNAIVIFTTSRLCSNIINFLIILSFKRLRTKSLLFIFLKAHSISKACRNEIALMREWMKDKEKVFCNVNLMHHIILLRYVLLCKALILNPLTCFYLVG